MSIKLLSAAWDLDIGSTEKMVLMCLCDYANDDGGNCWPSVATIARKCSKSERTIQGAIQTLKVAGYLTIIVRAGTSNRFQLDPRKICTPAKSAPPQKTTDTPAKSAPKPSRTTSKPKGAQAREMPIDWQPLPFTSGTKSKSIEDGWPPGDREHHLEHFTAHHRSRGSKFKDWQDAWSTWVLNTAKFQRGSASGKRPANDEIANPYVRAAVRREAERATFGG